MGQFSKKWEDLDFSDNFIFCKVMKNEELCKEMLQILLKLNIKKIEYLNTEQHIETIYDAKGIRMDVFLKDSDKVIDIEMQTGNYDDLFLRSRYYQSAADISTVPRRTKFKDLKENYILFICKDDPLGLGLPCYTKKSIIAEDSSIMYNDKTHNVFYNCSAYAKEKDESVRSVLEFIYKYKADSPFTKKLENSVSEVKIQEAMRGEYMFVQDIIDEEKEQAREIGLAEGRTKGLAEGRTKGLAEGRTKGLAEGRAEGRAEGISEGKTEVFKKLLNTNTLTAEQISELFQIPLTEIKSIAESC